MSSGALLTAACLGKHPGTGCSLGASSPVPAHSHMIGTVLTSRSSLSWGQGGAGWWQMCSEALAAKTPSSAPAFKNSHKSQLRGRSAGILRLTADIRELAVSLLQALDRRISPGGADSAAGQGEHRDYSIAGEEMGLRL